MGKRARFQVQPAVVQSEDFAALESPHPYGVLPGGNHFFSENASTLDNSPTRLLTDECWNHVLGFCNGEELGKIVQTCRYFYVAGHQPELWRDLVLRRQGNETITSVGPSWKDTYVKLFHPDSKQPPHSPMPMRGIYSDVFYRLHSCRSFAIPSAWLDVNSGTVPRISVEKMTIETFQEHYEVLNRPVVIEGAAKSWKAFERWQDPDYCLKNTSNRSFRATSGVAPLPANFVWQAYYDYCSSSNLEEAPLYLFDRTALCPGSDLWNDYMGDLQRSCPYWDPERDDTGHDLFKILGEGQRPDHTWLIVGPKRSGSVFHIDPNATHAWNAAIVGRKRWIFYPPGVTPPGVHPSQDGDEVALPLSVGEWIFQFWDEHVERLNSAPPNERPMECTALPGDVCFVPHGWWHMVVNLDDINIAITHNYVHTSNLPNVLKFMNEKRDQVSGCRDRAESIKPERLYEEFVEALRKHRPNWLQKALAEPDWTCRAWSRREEEVLQLHPLAKRRREAGDLMEQSGPSEKTNIMTKAKSSESTFSFAFL